MNPTDKFEQIQIYKRLNPVQQEAMVLKHEQEIKDIAKHLLALNKKEKKEWVGLTDMEVQNIVYCRSPNIANLRKAEQLLKDKNT